MFSFFRKKIAGKPELPPEAPDSARTKPSDRSTNTAAVATRARADYDVTNDISNTTQKDVVNLLIPKTDYAQKPGVGNLFNMMAGKKRRNKKNYNITRAESCREISPQKEMPNISLQRSNSELDKVYRQCEVTRSADDVTGTAAAKNTVDDAADPADFVKALVLQKYANKSPIESKKQHVSLVYVSDEPDLDDKRRTEALLREIARSIDCTIDQINADNGLMGATDSKSADKKNSSHDARNRVEPVYETIDDGSQDSQIKAFKDDLRGELEKLMQQQNAVPEVKQDDKKEPEENDVFESPVSKKKSNLKPPRSDTEGCSDDDRSDCGKKRVTFRKHIVFDDGDEQTDEEMESTFESLTSSEEEESEEDDMEVPDNDERLGGVTVTRNDNENNKTVIENINDDVKIVVECSDDNDQLRRISSDNSDSGFLEISEVTNESNENLNSEVKTLVVSESDSENASECESEVTDSETYEEVIIEEIDEDLEEEVEEELEEEEEEVSTDDPEYKEAEPNEKTLYSQESKFASQVASLTELADVRCGEAERARDVICQCRKELEAKDNEIERLKCSLASAYKESELIRQRSRSLEEELTAARTCSADLANQLTSKNADETIRQLRSELEDALTTRAELESRVIALEREIDRLQQEKRLQEQIGMEAVSSAESEAARWRLAHEAARSQAAAAAERLLADCEWKTRELERRACRAEREKQQLTSTIEQLRAEQSQPSAELQQVRGLAAEQQRSVQALALQLQRVETREEALKLEVHRLKELLEREGRLRREKEEAHHVTITRMEQQHSKAMETFKSEAAAAAASSRAALERAHADRTRTALAQLRADAERDARNADRRLREVNTKFENLKEQLETKEERFEREIAEARSKADWELLQLRHMLDRADIKYANSIDQANDKFEKEKECLIEEWSAKLANVEEQAAAADLEAKKLLEVTRSRLVAEKNDAVNKLKEQHRREMDEQWERFMQDKETCLSRMKAECLQEGEEDRIKREKELLEELADLRAQLLGKDSVYSTLEAKAAACGRTLAVTEQELREALAREKDLREKRSEDQSRIRQAETSSKNQVEHLTRKCACLKKLFDDMRTRLAAKESAAEQDLRSKDRELAQLRAEVSRLTKLLMEQGSSKLGARTRADGCETQQQGECQPGQPSDNQPTTPRRKGGTIRTPEPYRRRPTTPDMPSALPPETTRMTLTENQDGRRRANSVDLPAVQVPVRIQQFKELEGRKNQ